MTIFSITYKVNVGMKFSVHIFIKTVNKVRGNQTDFD